MKQWTTFSQSRKQGLIWGKEAAFQIEEIVPERRLCMEQSSFSKTGGFIL